MARATRLQYPGAYYHITDRGDRKEAIFTQDSDRVSFLQLLNSTAEFHRWHILAYCLMDNHYHLVLETTAPNLASGMARLNGVYTQRFNRRYQRVGHVFQGRYKSQVLQSEHHLLEACRYVVLNPVRAGMVGDPALWQWSSYRACAGLAGPLSCLDAGWVRERVAETGSFAGYIDWIHEGIGEDCPFLHPQPGRATSAVALPRQALLTPASTVPELSVLLAGCTWVRGGTDTVRTKIRSALESGYSQQAIARELHISTATLSRIASSGNEHP
ncbi:MAG: transposase [Halothiobacillaceae bacterium]